MSDLFLGLMVGWRSWIGRWARPDKEMPTTKVAQVSLARFHIPGRRAQLAAGAHPSTPDERPTRMHPILGHQHGMRPRVRRILTATHGPQHGTPPLGHPIRTPLMRMAAARQRGTCRHGRLIHMRRVRMPAQLLGRDGVARRLEGLRMLDGKLPDIPQERAGRHRGRHPLGAGQVPDGRHLGIRVLRAQLRRHGTRSNGFVVFYILCVQGRID